MKKKVSLVMAFLFLMANMVFVFPHVSAAQAVWADPTTAGFDPETAQQTSLIYNNMFAFIPTTSTFNLGNTGTGRNGTRAGVLSINSNITVANEYRVSTRNQLIQNPRQGHTYHASVWVKTDRDNMNIGLRCYLGGYYFDTTNVKTGQTLTNTSGLYPTQNVAKDEWQRLELQFTVNSVKRRCSNDSSKYYTITPNADGTYPQGNAVYNADGTYTWTPTSGTVRMDFFVAVFRNYQAGNWPSETFPVNVYLDDWYMLEEDGPTGTYTVAPLVYDATVTAAEETGQTVLSANAGIYNGNLSATTTASYQWQYSPDGTTWSNINGATGQSFTPGNSYIGTSLRALVTASSTDSRGTVHTKTLASAPYQFYSATPAAPVVRSAAISGTPFVREALSAEVDVIDPNGDPLAATGYQWQSSSDQTTWTDIPGATSNTYTVPETDGGKYYRVGVTPHSTVAPMDGTTVYTEPFFVHAHLIYYVAPTGSDTNAGTIDAPFATLEKARNTLRTTKPANGGATVYLRGGTYPLSATFTLAAQDTGTAQSPISYRAYGNEKVVLSGGVEIDYSKFSPVTGTMKDKLPAAAKDHVLVGDLNQIGIGTFNQIPITNTNSTIAVPMFLFDGKLLNLSRWPNSNISLNWPKVNTINRGYCDRFPAGDSMNGTGLMKVSYTDSRPATWNYNLSDIIYLGYWRNDWYAEALYATLNKTAKTIEASSSMYYGADGNNRPFRVFNVFEEIDEPGEWYIDRTGGKMYFYPYATTDPTPSFRMSKANYDLISVQNASYITFYGLEVTGGKKKGIVINGGTQNRIDSCDINTFETQGVSITGGSDNGICNSSVYNTGTGGIILNGGDKASITPAGNFVTNNHIHDFSFLKESYAPAVNLGGVGNKVDHNEIYNAAHQAISFAGVDNVMEYNVFHDVCTNAADMGAIYSGRSLADHDNIIRYNHFYDIGNPSNTNMKPCAVFIDDGSSDVYVYGNVFGAGIEACEANKINGGMRNSFTHNLYIDVPHVMRMSDWPNATWQASVLGDRVPTLRDSFNSVKNNPLYLARWPWLEGQKQASTMTYHPNVLGNNVIFYIGQTKPSNWAQISGHDGHTISGLTSNLFVSGNTAANKAYFVDYANGNYALTEAAYAMIRQTIPDFETIPFEEMGTY